MSDQRDESKAGALWWRISDGTSMAALRSRAYLLTKRRVFASMRSIGPEDPDDWYQWQLERTKDNAPA